MISVGATEPTLRIDSSILEYALWGGLGALVLVVGIGAFIVPIGADDKPALPPGAKWTWSDSWASNLTALTTSLGTVAALFSDKLKSYIDQSVLVTYGLTTALLLVIASSAPLLYASFQDVLDPVSLDEKERKVIKGAQEEESGLVGTWRGWCMASSVTIFAVEGSMFAAQRSLVLTSGGGLRVVVMVGIGLIQILVIAYAWRTFALVFKSAKGGKKIARGLQGIVSESCCGSSPVVVQRMTLM